MWFDLWDVKVLSRHRNLSFKPETTHRRSRWSGSPRGSLIALQRIFRPKSMAQTFQPQVYIPDYTCSENHIVKSIWLVVLCLPCKVLFSLDFLFHLGKYISRPQEGKVNAFSQPHSNSYCGSPWDEAYFQMEPDNPGDRVLDFQCSWEHPAHVGVLSSVPASRGRAMRKCGSLGQPLTLASPTPSPFGNQRGHLHNMTSVEYHNLFCGCRWRNIFHFLS